MKLIFPVLQLTCISRQMHVNYIFHSFEDNDILIDFPSASDTIFDREIDENRCLISREEISPLI